MRGRECGPNHLHAPGPKPCLGGSPRPRQPPRPHTSAPLTTSFRFPGASPRGCQQNPAPTLSLLGLRCLQPPAGNTVEKCQSGCGHRSVSLSSGERPSAPETTVRNKDHPATEGPGDPHAADTAPPSRLQRPTDGCATWEKPESVPSAPHLMDAVTPPEATRQGAARSAGLSPDSRWLPAGCRAPLRPGTADLGRGSSEHGSPSEPGSPPLLTRGCGWPGGLL